MGSLDVGVLRTSTESLPVCVLTTLCYRHLSSKAVAVFPVGKYKNKKGEFVFL
jgi:hypothetical protein